MDPQKGGPWLPPYSDKKGQPLERRRTDSINEQQRRENQKQPPNRTLKVVRGTFQGDFEAKNGSGSWIRTSDQVVNRSCFRTRKYLIQPERPFLLTL